MFDLDISDSPTPIPFVIIDPTRPPREGSGEGAGASEPFDPAIAFTLIILGCFLLLLPAAYYGLSYIYRTDRGYGQFDDIEFVTVAGEIRTESEVTAEEPFEPL